MIKKTMLIFNHASKILMTILLSSCASTIEEIKQVGKIPELSKMDPPVLWAPNNNFNIPRNANSLWQPGARDFFRDNRATGMGDILKVSVFIQDYAKIDNQTNTTRTSTESISTPSVTSNTTTTTTTPPPLFGISPVSIATSGSNNITGTGLIDRKDKIKIDVAAMVKQILPNGNLVIEGTQEIRINGEVRELSVAGIVRQEDVSSENSVSSDQIAEARISYGGRGTLSRVQKPRYGSQILDIILPW